MISLPTLLNLGGLFILLLYIYALFAMNFFAELKFSEPLEENLNF